MAENENYLEQCDRVGGIKRFTYTIIFTDECRKIPKPSLNPATIDRFTVLGFLLGKNHGRKHLSFGIVGIAERPLELLQKEIWHFG